MSALNRYRVLFVLCAGISGSIFTWQAMIGDFVWRVILTGLGGAFAGAGLMFYAHVVRLMK
jgi:hypothetical protein